MDVNEAPFIFNQKKIKKQKLQQACPAGAECFDVYILKGTKIAERDMCQKTYRQLIHINRRKMDDLHCVNA